MNARQLKKRKKNSYYIGVFVSLFTKITTVECDSLITITVTPAKIRFNQHNYARIAKVGKKILTKYSVKDEPQS